MESVCRGNSTGGSNPPLSASISLGNPDGRGETTMPDWLRLLLIPATILILAILYLLVLEGTGGNRA